MKLFRLKDRTRASLLEGPEKYKPPEIEKILKRFPNGRFVLVGDSGERDPEIYAALARKHPNQIARVLIRNATGQGADAPRYQQTFRDLPREVWDVFDDSATVSTIRGMD
jgi:phosphatidate phosphatase APP1